MDNQPDNPPQAQEKTLQPIIIKRVKRSVHGSHGGSWKVAFADFATAMMAFFLLLWLIGNSSSEEKEAISGYFNDPSGFQEQARSTPSMIGDGGANVAVIEMEVAQAETKEIEKPLSGDELSKLAEEQELLQLEQLKERLESLVNSSKVLEEFKDQILIDIIPTGLRIQIVDKDKRPMFDSGSAHPKEYSRVILRRLASVLKEVPNQLSVTGHTDSIPYVELEDYGNWELSADRANSARRELIRGGIPETQIARVEGFSSSVLFDNERPQNPINRRIAIIVLKQSAAEDIKNTVLGIK